MKKIHIIFSVIAISLFVLAQPFNSHAQREKPTAQEMATRETSMMKKELTLTSDQETKVQAMNLKYAEMRQQNADGKNGDRSKMESMQKDKDGELKNILTPEQYDAWKKRKTETHGQKPGEGKHKRE